MSLLQRLGLAPSDPPPRRGLAAAVHARHSNLPRERAELLAAFAGLLVRVADVDGDISAAEREAFRSEVAAHGGVSVAEAEVVAEIVVAQATGLAGIDYASLTRTFNEHATPEEKEQLLECLYAVAGADTTVSLAEDEEIRSVATALLLSHTQFIAIPQRHKDSLEVLQYVRKKRDE